MGKKLINHKDKRQQMKEERIAVAASQKLVNEANKIENPLSSLVVFHQFNKNALHLTIEYKKSTDLSDVEKKWILDLEERNMKTLYENCESGWDLKSKREEMMDDRACYLLARHVNTENYMAFSHFRFDIDFSEPVLYCYELQLEKEVQRKGLGKFLIQALELMAFKNNMKKVVLTTFKHNTEGLNFFHSLNYTTDETSPVDENGSCEDYHYFILSKKNIHFKLITAHPPIVTKGKET